MSTSTDRKEGMGPHVDVDAVDAARAREITEAVDAAERRATDRLRTTGFFSVSKRKRA